MVNPFNTSQAEGFNFVFFMMSIFIGMYSYQAWHGSQGYMAAAKNAHEAKMARIIGSWRQLIQVLLMMMLPIAAFTLMNHADFADKAQSVRAVVDNIENDTIQKQVLVSVALTKILPAGILGLFAVVMLAAAISTDDTYLHSWGSIFIQDVILPFRKKGFTKEQHIRLLRFSIFFVALFIFVFSLLFHQNEFIYMYFAMTGAVYLGGAGSVIIGGLYWKRGSTLGAWMGMITGSSLAFGGLLLRQLWPNIATSLLQHFPDNQFLLKHIGTFPLNGMQINFYAIIVAIIAYVTGSLLSWILAKRPATNMNKILHRGKYAISGDHSKGVNLPPTGLKALLPTKEFTKMDKVLYYALIIWIFGWFAFFIGTTIYHFIWGTSDGWWIKFWSFKVILTIVLGIFTTIWFLIGGIYDFRSFFKALKTAVRDEKDDGRVASTGSLQE